MTDAERSLLFYMLDIIRVSDDYERLITAFGVVRREGRSEQFLDYVKLLESARTLSEIRESAKRIHDEIL